ncbi:MAG: HEAT repeat domain-containing protein [Proteobacteria bacterium]|nr:HEAT repeat domain-containing protein [Pseudomonadota bacterium]MBU4469340.1 HEAT repeat domain-containing protein [Pseudomonadota bacterium]MCG2753556.1 HEAT repeat domain-containing protein [Desulfobacteraceae bacterium]
MISKKEIQEKAAGLGFSDIGFTSADPFDSQREILESRMQNYQHMQSRLDLLKGTDPVNEFPQARAIIVLLESYFTESFPRVMESHFGRCYQDDDRVTRDKLYPRIKAFREFLKNHGIQSKVPGNIPQRLSAARAGVANFGKNNFLYANRCNAGSSWVLPIPILVDIPFEPDEPSVFVGCPDWCRNTCIASCPTRALSAPGKINPGLCISYLTYYATEITPMDLREPMGTWVFGCDRCQDVCPRNAAWKTRALPINQRVASKADDFELTRLLHMDKAYFEAKIKPHMFYIGSENLWLWKMNTARAMGNALNPEHIPHLIRAFGENEDARVKGMIAWALGRIGGKMAIQALTGFLNQEEDPVKSEIEHALKG